MRASVDQRVNRAFQVALGLSLILILALVVEAGLFVSNVRIGQAALDEAARAAARAVDVVEVDGVVTYDLRLAEIEGRPSAYTLAEEALAAAANRVTLTSIVSDGGAVFVRGTVTSPTLFARVFGVSEITFELVASAEIAQ